MSVPVEKMSISAWLAELHMECYKKYLDDFETIKQLLELKDSELKKLGVTNSKDRATMMGSLASIKKESPAPRTLPAVSAVRSQEKPPQKKGSLTKLKLKSLLSSGGSKKNKKKSDNPPPSSSVQVQEIRASVSPSHDKPRSSTIDDYEEIPDLSPRSRAMTVDASSFRNRKAIENEYVPTPDSSPHLNQYRTLTHTMGSFDDSYSGVSDTSSSTTSRTPSCASSDIQYRHRVELAPIDDTSSALKKHHLSGTSMESGLSFGYDVEKDFNPNLPLENQPWFREKISRSEAEGLLHDDGDFIVRENTVILKTYTLSLRWRGVYDHTMVNTTEVITNKGDISRVTGVKFHFESGAFDSIPELIFNHLKYQIPINTAQHILITNPICRPGTTTSSTAGKVINPPPVHTLYTPQPTEHSTAEPSFSTLPRNFGSWQSKSSSPDESPKTPYAMTRGCGTSPRAPHLRHSNLIKSCNSSGDLLEEPSQYSHGRSTRSIVSPPPPIAEFRTRAVTTSGLSNANSTSRINQSGPVIIRHESFGDYELMGSVSLSEDTSGQSTYDRISASRTQTLPSNSKKLTPTTERVNYAELMCLKNSPQGKKFALSPSVGREAVKYAEVRFANSQGPNYKPVIVDPTGEKTSPYQSRAELLASKLHGEGNHSTPNLGAGYATVIFNDSPPHPFSKYSSMQRHTPSSGEESPQVHRAPPASQSDSRIYAKPDKSFKKTNRLSSCSIDSNHSSSSGPTSTRPHHQTMLANVHSHAPSAKVHRDLPGYEVLVKVHTLLQGQSNKQLAYHLTRSDAVAFLLAPRPGEEDRVWRDRVRNVTSSSGMYSGLQTLADPDGERLWKKLYFRHINLSQLVTLSVITAGDALERARLLHRFIDIAFLLQSGKLGNLYSFISIIQGMNVPQITEMVEVWELVGMNFPNAIATYKELQSIISSLNEGISMYSSEHIMIPAIQHLRTVFHFSEPSALQGFAPTGEDFSVVGEYGNLACGLDGIRTIVSHTAQFSYNARAKLSSQKYDAKLMDFFGQDLTRVYLQSIGVHVDDPMERRRRFGVLMDALIMRVDASESV